VQMPVSSRFPALSYPCKSAVCTDRKTFTCAHFIEVCTLARSETRIPGKVFFEPKRRCQWCNTKLRVAARRRHRRHLAQIRCRLLRRRSQAYPAHRLADVALRAPIGQCAHNLRSWEGRDITLNLPACGGWGRPRRCARTARQSPSTRLTRKPRKHPCRKQSSLAGHITRSASIRLPWPIQLNCRH
jgi:hypothetical protein